MMGHLTIRPSGLSQRRSITARRFGSQFANWDFKSVRTVAGSVGQVWRGFDSGWEKTMFNRRLEVFVELSLLLPPPPIG